MPRPPLNIPALYAGFNAPTTGFDCGQRCAPYNPRGVPFCCDICCAVPVVYQEEWEYLRPRTALWHPWRGDECGCEPEDPSRLEADTPQHMRQSKDWLNHRFVTEVPSGLKLSIIAPMP